MLVGSLLTCIDIAIARAMVVIVILGTGEVGRTFIGGWCRMFVWASEVIVCSLLCYNSFLYLAIAIASWHSPSYAPYFRTPSPWAVLEEHTYHSAGRGYAVKQMTGKMTRTVEEDH